ncbi:glycosyltransferase family 2 protein [Cellulomonas edaphi]|uniref:Glycosyltransferase family 2 protein n=1 Tax=Cellulomonas edaphi TaxID=3053468 RepID=A0ABT7S4Z9_9CELL|nr:glycosyltransferase family 2 protein [Cellulomons edaphi]MDM7830687.1 glycosyltransferase family 2 protein [Cellulomons edaphi]
MPGPVALVVVNHGSAALLDEHLRATAHGLDALVVVVDNSPTPRATEQARAVARAHGWHLVTTPNDGFGAGVNSGIAAAHARGARAVLVLNPDLALDPASARLLLDAALAAPRTMLAPVIRRPDGSVWSQGGTLDLVHGSTSSRPHGDGRVDWISGACLCASTEAWLRVGGFDDRYFLYWEDVDLSWRARSLGVELVVRSDVEAVHDVGGTQEHAGSRRKSDLYYAQNCRGRLVFAAHHLAGRQRARWVLGAPAYAWRTVKRGGRRQLLSGPGPLLAAARGTVSGAWYATRRRDPWAGPVAAVAAS